MHCINKDPGAREKRYANNAACSKCINKEKCTTSKLGRVITRKNLEIYSDLAVKRTKENKEKYSQRQAIIEHVFGTLKRSMNFTYFLLRGFGTMSRKSTS